MHTDVHGFLSVAVEDVGVKQPFAINLLPNHNIPGTEM